jgi:putative peptidoglycan lipid II flippase
MATSDDRRSAVIARSAGTVGVAVVLSRLLGLVREQVFAALFGSGFAYDAFVVAYRIPGLFRELLAEGALSAVIVTVVGDLRQRDDPQRIWRLSRSLFCAVALLVGGLVIAVSLLARAVVGLLAPEFTQVAGKFDLTAHMAAVMIPFLLLLALSAVAMGLLNSHGRFLVPALSNSFFNLGSVIAGVLLAAWLPRFGRHPIEGMAWGVLVGGGLQFGIQLPALVRAGWRPWGGVDFGDPALRRVLMLMVPAIIGLAGDKINIFVNTYFAAGCDQGSVSWLNYAFRLLVLPVGLVGVSLSIASTPVISACAASGELGELKRTLVSATVMSLLLSVPASVGLIFLARPIIALLFEHGRFTALDTRFTAEALICYSLGIAAHAAIKITVPVFYALGRARYPVAGSLATVALNCALVPLLLPELAFRAVALSTSVCVTVNYLFLLFMLHRQTGGLPLRFLLRTLGAIAGMSLLMGAFAAWLHAQLAGLLPMRLPGRLAAVLLPVAAGALLYAAMLSRLRIAEVDMVLGRMRAAVTRWTPGAGARRR